MLYSFVTAAAKHLSSVEIDRWSSNQHEFNGVSSLCRMLGNNRQHLTATFIYYDETGEVLSEAVNMTWYDAREAHPTRTEYRLYYSENSVIRRARVNDLLVVGKLDNNSLVVIIAKNQCEYYGLFMRLFGLNYNTASYVIANNIAI